MVNWPSFHGHYADLVIGLYPGTLPFMLPTVRPFGAMIDPQIGVKVCNFRTQKADFLKHFALEQPANLVGTCLLIMPSKRKRIN